MKAGVKETASTRFSPFSNIREGWIISILLGLAFGVRLYLVFHTYLITYDGVLYMQDVKTHFPGRGRCGI
jgi:hypothetical protein